MNLVICLLLFVVVVDSASGDFPLIYAHWVMLHLFMQTRTYYFVCSFCPWMKWMFDELADGIKFTYALLPYDIMELKSILTLFCMWPDQKTYFLDLFFLN